MKNRMTRNRQLTLESICSHSSPVNIRSVSEDLVDVMDQATVYRSINWLEQHGLVEGFTFSCDHEGTMRYFLAKKSIHKHFLHCTSCHAFQEIDHCLADDISRLEEHNNVKIESHIAYFTGICSGCNSKNG